MIDAKCRGMGNDLFFPKRGGGQRKAKKICEECLVRVECRDYAERTNTHYGIWGGEVLKRWDEESATAIPPADPAPYGGIPDSNRTMCPPSDTVHTNGHGHPETAGRGVAIPSNQPAPTKTYQLPVVPPD